MSNTSVSTVDNPTSYPFKPECGISAWGKWTVQATANSGYTFDHWVLSPSVSGFNTKSNPAVFDSDGIYSLTAYFTSGSSVSVPSAPTNVLASDGTYSDSVRISWSASSGATSYDVYRHTSISGFKTTLGTTTSTFFDDTPPACGTTYYYWVRATNSSGSSDLSSSNTGYCESGGVTPPVDPPMGGVGAITATQAKTEIDETLALVILDVRESNVYETGHLLCAENAAWNSAFDFINYNVVANYKDIDILIYDQDGTYGLTAANYLASEGFSTVYYISGGLNAWEAKGYETITTATPCSVPPMADAGEDQTAFENAAVVLDGSDSSSTWVPLTYVWSHFSGPAVVLLNPKTATPTFTAPSVQEGGEEIIFHLKVINAQQVADTDSVSVFVTWALTSSSPVANAGAIQTVDEGDSVTLNANGSTDADNDIVSWTWTQIGSPAVTLTKSATSPIATFIAPDVSALTTLTFRVTVTDAEDNVDTDDVLITINNVEDPVNPAAPVADAGNSQIVDESTTVTLDGSGSSTPSGTITTYQWIQTSGTNVGSIAATATPSFTAPSIDSTQESLTFSLTVTNDTNQTSPTDTVTILVKDVAVAVGHMPVADAGSVQTVYDGATVTLNGSMSQDGRDIDGVIVSYEWKQISGEIVALSDVFSPNPTFVAPSLVDMLIFELTVTDNDGHQDTDDVEIIVNMNPPPVADAGADQVVKEKNMVTLDGSGSTTDGNGDDDGIKSYLWEQISGTSVTLSAADDVLVEFEAPNVDGGIITLIFELTVENYSGQQSTDIIAISVKNNSSDDSTCFISAIQ